MPEKIAESKTPAAKSDKRLGYFSKLRLALFSPNKLFDKVKTETGMGAPLRFFVITNLITSIILAVTIVLLAVSNPLVSFLSLLLGPLLALGVLIFAPIIAVLVLAISVIASFVVAALMHLFARMFGGVGGFAETYRAVAYSNSPTLIASIVAICIQVGGTLLPALSGILTVTLLPLLNIAFYIWGIVLLTIGLSKLHLMSKKRAVLVWLMPIIIIGVLIVALVGVTAVFSFRV